MTGYHAAGRRVDLGKPEHIADAETRAIYTRLEEISTARQKLERDDIVLDDKIAAAINAKPEGVAEALWAGESVDDEMDADVAHVESLRAESARLSKLLTAQRDAERIGVVKLNEALDAGAGAIAKANLSKLKSLPTKLAMIERVLAEVIDTHDTAAGLIHLLEERRTQGGALVLHHVAQTPRVELTLAQEHVREGIAKLRAEIEAAQATLKPRKGKKASVAPEAASEAHSDAQAAPVTVPAGDLGDLTIGEDDD